MFSKEIKQENNGFFPAVPHIEKAMLGHLMISPEWVDKVWGMLNDDYFTDTQAYQVYQAMKRIIEEGKNISLPLVADYTREYLHPNVIVEMADWAMGCDIYDCIRELKSAYVRRQAIANFSAAIKKCVENHRPVEDLLGELELLLVDLNDKKERIDIIRLGDHIEDLYMRLVEKKQITGIPTGYKKLDEMTGGLQKSDLVVVAGRPAMGKTAFALNILREVGLRQGKPVLMFSLEMNWEQIGMRLLAAEAKVDLKELRLNRINKRQWGMIAMHLNEFKNTPIYLDDTSVMDVVELRARARRAKKKYGIELIIVDYLQLMYGTGEKEENRQQEIANISRALKCLAKELDVPVIALSQLSRLVEYRKDTGCRPRLSDLRESGAIEQDADLVLFIYRPAVYGIEFKEFEIDGEMKEIPTDNLAEIIVAKQRNGPTGSVWLTFIDRYASFEELNLYPEANEVENL